jgi:hypothetical protein
MLNFGSLSLFIHENLWPIYYVDNTTVIFYMWGQNKQEFNYVIDFITISLGDPSSHRSEMVYME